LADPPASALDSPGTLQTLQQAQSASACEVGAGVRLQHGSERDSCIMSQKK
jgi:hypothetical protein